MLPQINRRRSAGRSGTNSWPEGSARNPFPQLRVYPSLVSHAACDLANHVPAKDLAGNDPFLNLVGTLVDFADLGVAVNGLKWPSLIVARQPPHKSVAAANLDSVASDVDRQGASLDLRHRRKDRSVVTGIAHQSSLLIQRACGFK